MSLCRIDFSKNQQIDKRKLSTLTLGYYHKKSLLYIIFKLYCLINLVNI